MGVMVDTNVWSLALRRLPHQLSPAESEQVNELARLLGRDDAWLLGAVRQEVLSGIRSEIAFRRIRRQLQGAFPVPTEPSDYERAAEISNTSRAGGIASSPVDALLCAVAERVAVPIFTLDGDFERYSSVLGLPLHRP